MKALRIVCLTTLAVVAHALLTSHEVQARYAQQQLDKVPIERVLTNLEDAAAEKPKDAGLKFNLARAYAMGFASKQDEVQVRSQDQTLWFGYGPKNVPFQAQPTDDPQAKQRADRYLAKALETYEAALKLDPENNVGRLGYGWCLDQAGQADAAIEQYRKVIAAAWPKDQKLGGLGPGAHPLTVEAAEYLIPLLKKRDNTGKEIAELNARLAQIAKLPRAITPLAIPLADGLELSQLEDRNAKVQFDADGTGRKLAWSWIKPTAGWCTISSTAARSIPPCNCSAMSRSGCFGNMDMSRSALWMTTETVNCAARNSTIWPSGMTPMPTALAKLAK